MYDAAGGCSKIVTHYASHKEEFETNSKHFYHHCCTLILKFAEVGANISVLVECVSENCDHVGDDKVLCYFIYWLILWPSVNYSFSNEKQTYKLQ